jgi:hypothetical protein
MRTSTRTAIAAGLVFVATAAVADTFTYEETSFYGSENARVYAYVVYRTLDEAAPVVTSASTQVNTESRGAAPAPAVQPAREEQSAYDEPGKPVVVVASRDVNEVKGRA